MLETPYLFFKHDLELLNRLFRPSCILIALTLYTTYLSPAFSWLGEYISMGAEHNRASVILCGRETCRGWLRTGMLSYLPLQPCCREDEGLKRGCVKQSKLKDYCIGANIRKSNVHLGNRVERILLSQIQWKNEIICSLVCEIN